MDDSLLNFSPIIPGAEFGRFFLDILSFIKKSYFSLGFPRCKKVFCFSSKVKRIMDPPSFYFSEQKMKFLFYWMQSIFNVYDPKSCKES